MCVAVTVDRFLFNVTPENQILLWTLMLKFPYLLNH